MITREELRLFVSYQRFCALVLLGGSALALASYMLMTSDSEFGGPLRWPVSALLLLAALGCMRFAWFIGSGYPRKRRATHLALRRISAGRFKTTSLTRYCEDPCYRVVAREILRHTSLNATEQQRVFRELVAKSREPAFLIFVNPEAEQGVSVQCEL